MASESPNFLSESSWLGRKIHLMGAGGIGVSALVEAAAARGAAVTACDVSAGGQVPRLQARGFTIFTGHDPQHLDTPCDLLVCTAAVPDVHPELQRARELGIPIISRMRMLAALTQGRRALCVTGAHGKTSSTWFLANILISAGRDPSVVLGGEVPEINGNFRAGQGADFVVETDESDNRLHEFNPFLALITNVDSEHLCAYDGRLDVLVDAYEDFWRRTLLRVNGSRSERGIAVGCGDDQRLWLLGKRLRQAVGRDVLFFGFDRCCAVRIENPRPDGTGGIFDLVGSFGAWRELRVALPGRHNIVNAAGAATAAWALNVNEAAIRQALGRMKTVGRRLEIKGEIGGVRVIDDYAHHPREVAASLSGARALTDHDGKGRLGVIFQPHRFTRLAALMDDFCRCFGDADRIFLLPVYAASEAPIPGADHTVLAEKIRLAGGPTVEMVSGLDEAVEQAAIWSRSGDAVVTQGAGTVTLAADKLLARLKLR